MEEKLKKYQEYNFREDQRWQSYLNNLYPMPSMQQLEKRKKKWYRDNVDKDLDLNYSPEEEQKQQRQQNGGPPPGVNPYAHAYQHYAQEAYPQYRHFVGFAYLAFVLTLPFSGITNKIALVAWIVGMVQKHGMPKFSKDYLRQVAPSEHFLNLGYLSVTFILNSVSFIVYAPLVLYSYVIISETFINYAPAAIKVYLQKGITNKVEFTALKADLEIYVGLYLIIGWFFSLSNIFSIFIFWQFMRIKWILNITTQQAFTKFKTTVDGYVYTPNTPGILRTVWEKIKSWGSSMVVVDQAQDGRQSPSMCAIF